MSTGSTKPYQIVKCPRTTVKRSYETALVSYIRWKSYDTLRPDRQEDVQRYSGWEKRNPSTCMHPPAVNSALDNLVGMTYPKKFSYTNQKKRIKSGIKSPELSITRFGQSSELIFFCWCCFSLLKRADWENHHQQQKTANCSAAFEENTFFKRWPFIQPYTWPICYLT